ncbi:MAG: polysaccharide deacetylase family protein [bacterium]
MSIRNKWNMIAGLALGLLCLVVITRWLCLQRVRPVFVPILMYHRIGDEVDSPWWVTVRDFETQLQSLHEQGYTSVWPSDLAAHQRWGWPLPGKPIVLTFDDGYLNLMQQVEPLLLKYGFHGVSYLITGKVGDTPETRQQWEGTPLLIWPEVRAVQQRGTIRFGGHSRTHANLRALTDSQQEISSCYRDLKRKGGLTPEGFCFPYGQYKEETLTSLARSKFTTATTCADGIAELKPDTALFELPRVSVMGGWHRFHLQPRPETAGGLAIEISKEGRDLDVTPKVIRGDGTYNWLPRIHVTTSPLKLHCTPEDSHPHPAAALELWDNFRVIRLYRVPLYKEPFTKRQD